MSPNIQQPISADASHNGARLPHLPSALETINSMLGDKQQPRSSPLAADAHIRTHPAPDAASLRTIAADIRVLLAASTPSVVPAPLPALSLFARPGGVGVANRPERQGSPLRTLHLSRLAIDAATVASGAARLPSHTLTAWSDWAVALIDEVQVDCRAVRAPAVGWLTGDDVSGSAAELLGAYDSARAAREAARDALAVLESAASNAPCDDVSACASLDAALRAKLLGPSVPDTFARLRASWGSSEGEAGLHDGDASWPGRPQTSVDATARLSLQLEAALQAQLRAAAGVAVAHAAIISARREELRKLEQESRAMEAHLLRLHTHTAAVVEDSVVAREEEVTPALSEAAARHELLALASARGYRIAVAQHEAQVDALRYEAAARVASVRSEADTAVAAAVAEGAATWDAELAGAETAGKAARVAAAAHVARLSSRVELGDLKREVRKLGATALATAAGLTGANRNSARSGASVSESTGATHVHALLCRFYAASLRHATYSDTLHLALQRGLDHLLRRPSKAAAAAAAAAVGTHVANVSPPAEHEKPPLQLLSAPMPHQIDLGSLCSGWRRRHASTATLTGGLHDSSLAAGLRFVLTSSMSRDAVTATASEMMPESLGQGLLSGIDTVQSGRTVPPAFKPPPRPRVDEDDDAFIASLLATLEQVEAVANRGHPPEGLSMALLSPASSRHSEPKPPSAGTPGDGLETSDAKQVPTLGVPEHQAVAEQAPIVPNTVQGQASEAATLPASPLMRDAESNALQLQTSFPRPTAPPLTPILRRGDSARLRPAHVSFNEMVEVAIVADNHVSVGGGVSTDSPEVAASIDMAEPSSGREGGVSAGIWAEVFRSAPPTTSEKFSRPSVEEAPSLRAPGLTSEALDSVLSLLGLDQTRNVDAFLMPS